MVNLNNCTCVYVRTSRTILAQENGIIFVTGISLGICVNNFEIPYIGIFEHIGWIETQIYPGRRVPRQVHFGNQFAKESLSETSGILFPDNQRSCPVIVESESEIRTCEGHGRYVQGQVKIDPLNDCNIFELIGSKVFCNGKSEHDIFCPILPRNITVITLDEAQNLCRQKSEDLIRTENAEVDSEETNFLNTSAGLRRKFILADSTAVIVEAPKDHLKQKYGE